MQVPFVDLRAQYRQYKDEIDKAMADVVEHTAFVGGSFVSDFEQAFADELGMDFCVGVANGTDALYLVMKMLGVGPGDEIITTAVSWISTPEMVSLTGATPVFVDIDPDFFTIDPEQLEGALTPKTKGILPVHLYGQMTEMDAVMEFAHAHGLFVLEDCAQSHFSTYKGAVAGSMGVAGTFSFYPGKNLGAYGDAGAIVTNHADLVEKLRMYRNHGQKRKHQHLMEGVNSRLDGLQASILSAKLPHIHEWNHERRSIADRYTRELRGVGDLALPEVRRDTEHTFHVFAVRTRRRDELRVYLKEHNIDTAIHYPHSLPFMPPYRSAMRESDGFPQAKQHQEQTLSLPMYAEMTGEMMNWVVASIQAFYQT